jgi:hypothetical protein
MVPAAPTAQPWVVSGKETETRSLRAPGICGVQCAPPSVVLRMVAPKLPTAQPWVESGKATENSRLRVPDL